MRRIVLLASIAVLTVAAVTLHATTLPSGWHLTPSSGAVVTTGTMPQGLALSPDGSKLAVVESGINPAALRIVSVPDLHTLKEIPLKDAFGTPVWHDDRTVYVAGGSANDVIAVDSESGATKTLVDYDGYPVAIATAHGYIGIAGDLSGGDVVMPLPALGATPPSIHPKRPATNAHAAAVVLTATRDYVAFKGASIVTTGLYHPLRDGSLSPTETIAVDLHPAALALSPDGSRLYVACADADSVDVIDTRSNRVIGRIDVGLPQGRGASPNALAVASDGTLYVSLGAENAVAEIRDGKVVARVPVGWYPTGLAVDANNVYVTDGKGEGSHANPGFEPYVRHSKGYVASILTGSLRTIARAEFTAASTQEVLANIPKPVPTPAQTVVRPGGPIKHVIYIIKENRTYDQVLGDIRGANGDPHLTMFGEAITPNQHAIARRFGIFDDVDANAQVSADGHNWSTAAFANDYLERFWPVEYGGRRDLYDFEDGAVASTPHSGYLWDDADAHHVSLRDYGEFVSYAVIGGGFVTTSMPGLKGHVDDRYPPFDLNVSDKLRVDEWEREFNGYVRNGKLPALEIIRLPNDHTAGTKPGMLTPQAYVAQNDRALGRIVQIVSHSRYWADTAIFAIEDDAQNGPDHVDDQRTTFYLASPYAARGVHHAHYTTAGVLRTIELLLGLPPMSIYDAVAPPLYDAFTIHPDVTPFDAVMPRTNMSAKNLASAYGAAVSARMDWAHADRNDPRVLNDILEHATGIVKR